MLIPFWGIYVLHHLISMERQNWNIKDTQTFSNHHVQSLGRGRKKKMKNFSHFLFANIFILQNEKKIIQKNVLHNLPFFIADYVFASKHQGTSQEGTKEKKTKYDKVVTHLTNKNENRSLTNSLTHKYI